MNKNDGLTIVAQLMAQGLPLKTEDYKKVGEGILDLIQQNQDLLDMVDKSFTIMDRMEDYITGQSTAEKNMSVADEAIQKAYEEAIATGIGILRFGTDSTVEVVSPSDTLSGNNPSKVVTDGPAGETFLGAVSGKLVTQPFFGKDFNDIRTGTVLTIEDWLNQIIKKEIVEGVGQGNWAKVVNGVVYVHNPVKGRPEVTGMTTTNPPKGATHVVWTNS